MNPLNWRSLAPLSITFLLSTLSIPPGVFSAELPQPSKLQIRPSPKGKPDPIVVINRRTARRTALLASEQIDVLKKLQGAVYPAIVSALSPDGTTIVMAIHDPASKTPSFGLLNIQTGTRVAIEPESLRGFEPDGGWHWRDANTAVAIAIKHKSSGALESVLALVDRRNGKVKFQSLASALDSGVPVKLAPSTQQVLVADHFSEPGGSGEQDDNDNGDEARPIEYRVVNLSDGKELTRFVIPTGNEASAFTWSPDSTQLAFIQNWEPEESQAIGGESLFSLVTQNAMGALSPVDNPRLQRNVLQVINLTTGKKHTVQASSGDGAIFSAVAWSPDAQTLLTQVIYPVVLEERSQPIYAWSEQRGFRAYTANLQNMTSFAPPELSSKDGNGTGFQFISSNEVIVRALNGMEVQLYYYNLSSREVRKLTHQAGSAGVGRFLVVPEQRQIVFGYSSYTAPPELFRLSLNGGRVMPLTNLNQELAKLNQTRADPVTFTLANGERFDGMVIQPAKAAFPPQQMPMIVWQEGGPMSSMVNDWSAAVEAPYALLPNFGMAVLVVPLYGRYGFGHDRYTALYNARNFGQLDIDAMAEIVQQAIDLGYTSSGRVGITGCSYGGYFTTQSIARHPKLYAAANTQCSLIDTDAEWKTGNKGGLSFVSSQNPFTATSRFQQDSPIYNASQIQTPLLIFHGTQDFLPIALMENFYWKLASQGTPARMIKFVGSGHSLDASEYQLYAAQEMIQWFRTYLNIREKAAASGQQGEQERGKLKGIPGQIDRSPGSRDRGD